MAAEWHDLFTPDGTPAGALLLLPRGGGWFVVRDVRHADGANPIVGAWIGREVRWGPGG